MNIQMKQGDALVIIDPQNDFFPGGALDVPEGDQIIPVLNELITLAQEAAIPIFVTRDWHPEHHCSFKEHGGPWPKHCVQGTQGAQFHPDLQLPESALIAEKAFTQFDDPYSIFKGQMQDARPFDDALKALNIQRLWMGGLALDYCVKAAALDARAAHYDVNIVCSATRGITPESTEKTLKIMQQEAIILIGE